MISVNQKYIVLDDAVIQNGGTSLTLESILEDRKEECFFMPVEKLNHSFLSFNTNKIWIIGNTMSIGKNKDPKVLLNLLENERFIKIEFDYNFCKFRCEAGHEILGKQTCDCPNGIDSEPFLAEVYKLIHKNALHIFFMSERQKAVHSYHMPLLPFHKSSVLSSCFSKRMLSIMDSLKDNHKNNKYAILKGYGGWHSFAKGLKQAVEYCESNNIEYDILENKDFEDHLRTLSRYKGIVFFPIIDDTCPRCIIEARFMNLEIICNSNCQHIYEEWWTDKTKTLEYIKNRPKYFWNTIDLVS
jgi:hypothetical protein